MYEKVNPAHPDKVADRIAGAIVDLAYARQRDPRVAAEVLIGHGHCLVVVETSAPITRDDIRAIVLRIEPRVAWVEAYVAPQDPILAGNQSGAIRCGDNGVFRGVPVTDEQRHLCDIARRIYGEYPTDGKYVIDGAKLVICKSRVDSDLLRRAYPAAVVNPLGDWTGGIDVDAGATNRKLGSDMGDSVTGGGLHGKDLSKADVSVNIYAWLKAQRTGRPVELSCAIGDEEVDGVPYADIVEMARRFIASVGGFERFAEWGLLD